MKIIIELSNFYFPKISLMNYDFTKTRLHLCRLSDLDALNDFLQSASAELNWLNEKEQIEITRDWADPHINLTAVEEYYEVHS